MHQWDTATVKAKDLVRMGVMRAALLNPLEEITVDIHPASLIIGAGISGTTGALSIASQGYEAFLVEKEPEVGGMLRNLHMLTPTGADPSSVIDRYKKRIKANQNIHLFTGATLKSIDGYFGNFDVTVATGSEEMKPDCIYGFGEFDNVITQGQLEVMLNEDRLPPIKDAVIIQCVGSRGQRVSYCNRICCMVGIKNAIAIKEKFPEANVSVLHNELHHGQPLDRSAVQRTEGLSGGSWCRT